MRSAENVETYPELESCTSIHSVLEIAHRIQRSYASSNNTLSWNRLRDAKRKIVELSPFSFDPDVKTIAIFHRAHDFHLKAGNVAAAEAFMNKALSAADAYIKVYIAHQTLFVAKGRWGESKISADAIKDLYPLTK